MDDSDWSRLHDTLYVATVRHEYLKDSTFDARPGSSNGVAKWNCLGLCKRQVADRHGESMPPRHSTRRPLSPVQQPGSGLCRECVACLPKNLITNQS